MREQRQISPRSLPHSFSSNCRGNGTARNATWLRYQGGKRQVNVRGTACEQAVIPFLQVFHGEHKANKRRNSFSMALLRFRASGGLMGARDGDTSRRSNPLGGSPSTMSGR